MRLNFERSREYYGLNDNERAALNSFFIKKDSGYRLTIMVSEGIDSLKEKYGEIKDIIKKFKRDIKLEQKTRRQLFGIYGDASPKNWKLGHIKKETPRTREKINTAIELVKKLGESAECYAKTEISYIRGLVLSEKHFAAEQNIFRDLYEKQVKKQMDEERGYVNGGEGEVCGF